MKFINICIIFVIVVINDDCYADVVAHENYDERQLEMVVLLTQEIKRIYAETGLVAFVHGRTEGESLEENYVDYLLKHYQFSLILYSDLTKILPTFYYKKPNLYVILVSDLERLSELLVLMHSLTDWFPQGNFMVIHLGKVEQKKMLFEILVQHYITNVIVVELFESVVSVWTYNPYKDENLQDPNLYPVYLDVNFPKQFYSAKSPLRWRNSSVLVTPVIIKPYVISVQNKIGIDMDITEIVRQKLEVALQYAQSPHYDWGWKLANGSYVSVFRILQLGHTDFVNGHFHFRDPDNLYDFDYTFSYTEDPLIWAVPCPVPISNWSGLIHIFSASTWYSIFGTLMISLVAWQTIGRIAESGRYFSTLYAIEAPFLLFLCLGVPVGPNMLSSKLIYLSSWYFGFICTTSWLSKLTAFLVQETYEERIKSVQEMIDRGLILGIHPELAEMYGESADEVGRFIMETFHECDLSGDCWDQVSYKKDMSTITTKRILRYITYDKYMSSKGEQLMVIIDGANVNMDYTVMFFKKGHPMCSRVSQLLMWIREAGFVNYFDAHINFQQMITNRREIFNPKQLETKQLNMDVMLAPFALLFIGLTLASIAFAFELLNKFCSSHKEIIRKVISLK